MGFKTLLKQLSEMIFECIHPQKYNYHSAKLLLSHLLGWNTQNSTFASKYTQWLLCTFTGGLIFFFKQRGTNNCCMWLCIVVSLNTGAFFQRWHGSTLASEWITWNCLYDYCTFKITYPPSVFKSYNTE